MICAICHSKSIKFENAGGINIGGEVTCYQRLECLHCGHSWHSEIDCPDIDLPILGHGDYAAADDDFDDDDQEPPSSGGWDEPINRDDRPLGWPDDAPPFGEYIKGDKP